MEWDILPTFWQELQSQVFFGFTLRHRRQIGWIIQSFSSFAIIISSNMADYSLSRNPQETNITWLQSTYCTWPFEFCYQSPSLSIFPRNLSYNCISVDLSLPSLIYTGWETCSKSEIRLIYLIAIFIARSTGFLQSILLFVSGDMSRPCGFWFISHEDVNCKG